MSAACTSLPPSRSVAPTDTGQPNPSTAFALLANGHLLVAGVDDGRVVADLALGTPSAQLLGESHAMALAADASTLYVLTQDASRIGHIAVVDTARPEVTRTIELEATSDYRGLDVGARTGHLFVFGNDEGAAVVWIVDPAGRDAPKRFVARAADGRTWRIYQGVVSRDESAVFLSYHGPDTTGVDRFELTSGTLARCAAATPPGTGCFPGHGSVHLVDDRLIVTTGEGPLLALDPKTGAILAQYDISLEGNHIMEFAVDGAGRAFVIGSCGYVGGLAMIDLAHGATRTLAPPRKPDSPCGEGIAVTGDGRRLVLIGRPLPVPSFPGPGRLVVLSDDGIELRRIPTSAEPIDLILVPPPSIT